MSRATVHVLVVTLTALFLSAEARADGERRFIRPRTRGGVEFGVLGTKPVKPAPTLFVFAGDLETTLTSPDFNKLGFELARNGFLCVSLDAPCHGSDNKEKRENELAGWRDRIEHGDELVKGFTERCTAVLDYLVDQGLADPARVAAAGTSRGGFLALHFAAAEPRMRSVAAFAPVTRLRVLAEFAGIIGPAATAADALSLDNVAANLAGRPIWICIGNNDQRVGTDCAIGFTRSVVTASVGAKKKARVELHVTTSDGHSVHPTAHHEAAAFIAAQTS